VQHFGNDWGDAPLAKESERVPTPDNAVCAWCEDDIRPDDTGVMMAHTTAAGTATVKPWHRECLARSTLGSAAHQSGTCTCQGGDNPNPVTPAERHADALAAWNHWNTRGYQFRGTV
jgi:hypothetical protein